MWEGISICGPHGSQTQPGGDSIFFLKAVILPASLLWSHRTSSLPPHSLSVPSSLLPHPSLLQHHLLPYQVLLISRQHALVASSLNLSIKTHYPPATTLLSSQQNIQGILSSGGLHCLLPLLPQPSLLFTVNVTSDFAAPLQLERYFKM